jgi:hypothetical protein
MPEKKGWTSWSGKGFLSALVIKRRPTVPSFNVEQEVRRVISAFM